MSCGSATWSPPNSLTVPAALRARARSIAIAWRDSVLAAIEAVARLEARRSQRLALAELDDRLLADIGVSRRQALAEARKAFWR